MDRDNFAGDEERLRALISDISSNDTGLLTIDQSFSSDQLTHNFSEEDDDDVPTMDEDDPDVPSELALPSDPDDTGEDMYYVPSCEGESSDDSTHSRPTQERGNYPRVRPD